MSTVSVVPERFDSGDFAARIRYFDCCSDANGWTDAEKVRKLPAFLKGQAASYFFSLPTSSRDSYPHLVTALCQLLRPLVAQERHYASFESRLLRPSEDPSFFLWDLQELLAKADSGLLSDAQNALRCRQFLKGLPKDLRLLLLEFDPTPTLETMRNFMQQYGAVHGEQGNPAGSTPVFASTPPVAAAPQEDLRSSINQLTSAVSQDLSATDQHMLLQTLLSFSDIFKESLGHTNVMQHKIDTGDALLIRQHPCRLPYV